MKNLKKIVIGFILFVLAVSINVVGLYASEKVRTEVVSDIGSRIILDYKIGDYQSESVIINGEEYKQIIISGEPLFKEKGAPALPHISRSIIIPDEGTPELRIVASRYREFPVDPVAPSKGPLPRSIDPATVPYEFSPLYREGGIFPAREAELTEPFILRDHRGVTLRLFPLRYDAGRGVLLVLESVTLEVCDDFFPDDCMPAPFFEPISMIRDEDELHAEQPSWEIPGCTCFEDYFGSREVSGNVVEDGRAELTWTFTLPAPPQGCTCSTQACSSTLSQRLIHLGE